MAASQTEEGFRTSESFCLLAVSRRVRLLRSAILLPIDVFVAHATATYRRSPWICDLAIAATTGASLRELMGRMGYSSTQAALNQTAQPPADADESETDVGRRTRRPHD